MQVVRFGSRHLDLLSHPAGPSQDLDKLPHDTCVLCIPATLKASIIGDKDLPLLVDSNKYHIHGGQYIASLFFGNTEIKIH